MKTLGEQIRELREGRDISLRELASRIGVSAAFMSDVELGRRHPSDKHMLEIAKALGATLEDLRQFDTRPPLREFRRAMQSDPQFGLAFRQMMDRRVSSRDILEFIKQWDENQEEEVRD